MTTYPTPILAKRAPRVARDYAPMTLDVFLRLRRWAQWLSPQVGAPVYLVGSALTKDIPRDVDIAVIWPLATFERLFGAVPTEGRQVQWDAFWSQDRVCYGHHAIGLTASLGVGFKPVIDVKLCPDVWYPDAPKLLLAEPDAAPCAMTDTQGTPLRLRKVVQYKADETGLLTQEVDRVLWDPAWLKEA